jgi:hypothetical protein
MANPIETLTKPVTFGARQAINLTQFAIRTGSSWIEGLTGGGEPQQQDERPTRRSSTQPKPLDDVAITRKVETQIFRDRAVPKGKIEVNTADGVVWLRGEAKNPEMVKRLEREARSIPEVRRVENLLHLPKTPAPTRTDTPPSQRKTRRAKASPASRRVTPRRVNAEKSTPAAEPSPEQLAADRRGRPPAPLGSNGSPDE